MDMISKVGGAALLAATEWSPKDGISKERAMGMAAIEAMRTPTEAMIRDGHLLDPLGCDVDDEDAAMIYTRIWGAMLSAALSPSGGK